MYWYIDSDNEFTFRFYASIQFSKSIARCVIRQWCLFQSDFALPLICIALKGTLTLKNILFQMNIYVK